MYDDKETGIPCFKCKERSGTDCAGRKPDEATLCNQCLEERLAEYAEAQAKHLASYLDGVRDTNGGQGVRRVWDLLSQEEKDELRKIIGDSGVNRILSVESDKQPPRAGGQWKGRVREIAESAKASARVDALRAVIAEIQKQNDLDDSEAAKIADRAMSWARSRDGKPGDTQ